MSERKEGTYSWLQMDISETEPDIPLATFFSFLSQLAWYTSPGMIMKIRRDLEERKYPASAMKRKPTKQQLNCKNYQATGSSGCYLQSSELPLVTTPPLKSKTAVSNQRKHKARQKLTISQESNSPKTSQNGISGIGSTYLTANERDPVG
ncbi:hypothetical protein Csa_008410 [Cucumis sativus]|uniref:Uncharacterized protein n=1 Tax=Cucumis sativus TaxID=3659 RepID=A0A0A0KWY9_CUCSA|nr:hypothetical protein Csa_008410 [Cucumis sativus]